MSFFDQEPPVQKPRHPRVNAWNASPLSTFQDPTYKERARNAQDAASASSSIVGGRIVKAVHAEPRSNLPSNVHGFNTEGNASSSGWDDASSNTASRTSTATGGHRFDTAGRAVGATNFSQNAPPGAPTPIKSSASSIPPHMRGSSNAGNENVKPGPTAGSKHSKHGTRSSPSMNPGVAAKSAKIASKIPCSYPDCSRGFEREIDMKNHKDEDHTWCRPCKLDFEDDDALLDHKMNSLDHICCPMCGQDFHSENGRDRHVRQSHPKLQVCKCVGCGLIFDKGSALVHHIYENRCQGRGSGMSTLLTNDVIRTQRAQAALHMDVMIHRPSTTAAEIANIQHKRETFDDKDSSDGGVPLSAGHILDEANEELTQRTEAGSSTSQDGGDSDRDLMAFSDGDDSDTQTAKPNTDFPTLGEAALVKRKHKTKESKSILDKLTNIELSGDPPLTPAKAPHFANGLFPIDQGRGEGTGTTMVDFREAQIPGNEGKNLLVKTDWDHMVFKRHAVDGHYHCPFPSCRDTNPSIDGLKQHLTSGFHLGTDNRCLKCLKKFKGPAALIAHMESNSEKCRVKDTEQYDHMIALLSGGFLAVTGRFSDGNVKIEALTMEQLKEQAEDHRAMLPVDDSDYPW